MLNHLKDVKMLLLNSSFESGNLNLIVLSNMGVIFSTIIIKVNLKRNYTELSHQDKLPLPPQYFTEKAVINLLLDKLQ